MLTPFAHVVWVLPRPPRSGIAAGDFVDRFLRIDVRLFLGALHTLGEFLIAQHGSRAQARIALQRRADQVGAGPDALQIGIAPGSFRRRPSFRHGRLGFRGGRLAGAQGGEKKQ